MNQQHSSNPPMRSRAMRGRSPAMRRLFHNHRNLRKGLRRSLVEPFRRL
jgi:hypothetical protein